MLPLGNNLPSIHVAAVVFSFTDFGPTVMQTLRVLSRRGRAYAISQEGLPGFLKYSKLTRWLNQSQSQGLVGALCGENFDFAALIAKDAKIAKHDAKLAHLQTAVPVLYFAFLKASDEDSYQLLKQNYREGAVEEYGLYTMFLEIDFEELQRGGNLHEGETTVKDGYGDEFHYVGPLDNATQQATKGVATSVNATRKYSGTFVNNLFEGCGVYSCGSGPRIGELKKGREHGRVSKDSENRIYVNGNEVYESTITTTNVEERWFDKKGKRTAAYSK